MKGTRIADAVRLLPALALIWWLLAGEGPLWLTLGAAGVIAALAAVRWATPRRSVSLRWSRLPHFFVWFIVQSVRGGLDVARRAASRDMRLAAGLVEIELDADAEGARVLTAMIVSLLPGTLAVRLDGHRLRLHALDLRLPVESNVRALQREVGALLRRVEVRREAPR